MSLSVLLAKNWDGESDPKGYWMSEKLDGVRAYWDGKQLLSRLGNVFPAPPSFLQGFPQFALDGELTMGRGMFQQTVGIVKRTSDPGSWTKLKYRTFDAPSDRRFEKRLQVMYSSLASLNIVPLKQTECAGIDDLLTYLSEIEQAGGEGVMLREPGSWYVPKRSSTLLKVKTFKDAEAVVVGHAPGKGKHQGRLGALMVKLPDGTEFELGTGFSDMERERPPRVGAIVTFKYQALTDGGVPRFASFLRVRKP